MDTPNIEAPERAGPGMAVAGHAPTTSALNPIADAVVQFDAMMQLGGALVKSGLLPKAINTPEKAVAIILTGREMGIGPMLALRSIVIIEGKPVISADLQLARFKANGGRAVFRTLDADKAVLDLVHPNGDAHTETFTMADAKAAGLLSKQNWRNFPKAMLRSRVITAGLKSIGYEPTAGVYDPDEADHFAASIRPAGSPTTEPEEVVEPLADGDGVEITRDSEITWGKKKGTKIKDLPDDYLQWAVGDGRKFGPDTAAWQRAMMDELETRADEGDDLMAEQAKSDVRRIFEAAAAGDDDLSPF